MVDGNKYKEEYDKKKDHVVYYLNESNISRKNYCLSIIKEG